MAERTPTAAQQAQLKRQSEQLAALDAEEKKLYSEDYQKTLTPQQYDQAAARLDELTAQRSELSRSQTALAAQAYGVDPASVRKGESVTFTTQDGVKVSVGGTGVSSQNAAARSNYAADEYESNQVRSETAGPRETRTTTTSTTRITGGDQRVTEMTPEMKSWTEKNSQANKLDEAAQRDAFLRSQGLENADKATQLKAITKARNQYDSDGNSTFDKYKSNSNRDGVGPPPAEQYKTDTIPVNKSGEQTLNDGTQTPDQAAKKSAQGQTAEQQIQNADGQASQPLTEEEKAKLDQSKSGELATKVGQSEDPASASKQNNTGYAAQKKSEADYAADQKSSDKGGSVTGPGVTGKKSDYTAEVIGAVPENILHRYTSYTYRISLFFLTSKDYNTLSSSPGTFVPKYCLISSAGGFATPSTGTELNTVRHPDFRTDFFIDGLSMKTIVGLNAKSKASNAIEISFTITEPYGLSLLDRLLSACETSDDKAVNYMSQPYLLQVDLLGNPGDEQLTTAGNTNNVITSKKIAIKLIEMKIKPTGTGTTYAVRAMPYNHSAFDTTAASLPVALNIEAGTVGEFFSTKEDLVKLFAGEDKADEERLESALKVWFDEFWSTGGYKPTPEEVENQRKLLKNSIKFNAKSLVAGYNTWMKKIAEEKKLTKLPPIQIAFNIPDKEIAESPIVDPDNSSTTDTALPDATSGYNTPAPKGKSVQTFSLNRGTSIIEVIDMVMSKSLYVKKQIETQGSKQNIADEQSGYTGGNERADNKKEAAKLKWYKVLPTVALKDFDLSTNTYSKTILYSILPYTAANSYHPNFARVNSQNVANSVVRVYDYLYTGKNQDIIRLEVDFDTSFYTLVTTKGDQVKRTGNFAGSDSNDVNKAEFATTQSAITNPPVVTGFSGSNNQSVGTAKSTDPDEQVIADMKGSLYTRQRGDALNLKLQIIGDPDFIKQDDVFYNPGSPSEYAKLIESRMKNNSKRPVTESGQILFDAEQVYVRVNVKNAVDIDDKIGIVNKQEILSNGRRTDGTFSGIYKVITVQSDFSRGQFTQTLDLIRIPDALTPPKKPIEKKLAPITAINPNDSNAPAANTQTATTTQTPPAQLATPQPTPVEPPAVVPTQPSEVTQVKQPLTFAEAFRQARKDFGNKPGGSFEWRGKLYQTNYQNEPYVKNPTPVYPGANQ